MKQGYFELQQTKLCLLVLRFLYFMDCLLVLSVLVSLSSLPTYARSCCRPELKEERKKKRCMCGKEIPRTLLESTATTCAAVTQA